ncbi:glycoside hydrolase family 130 protein [Planctomycetota bacterium]
MAKKVTVKGPALPSIPWEDRPRGCRDAVWRYSQNPIVPRDAIPCANSIFNSAVVTYKKGYAGVFRVDTKSRESQLHVGHSRDALNWDLAPDPIQFKCGIPELVPFEYGYDPRVAWVEDRYYVTWCNGYGQQPTIGVAWTKDFKSFTQIENAFLPYNRNGVMFPRKIKGKYCMLSRPSDTGHTPFGDMYLSFSPDMKYWGEHRLVMTTMGGWQSKKIGAGPIPIETSEGWLMIYHGVLYSCNGFVYSFGAALLDRNEPWKVIARGKPYLLSPQTLYECVGDVPNVAFPCAALTDAATGRMAIYYGGADTVVALCFGYVDEIIKFIKRNPV